MRFLGLHKQKLKYRVGLLEAKTEIPIFTSSNARVTHAGQEEEIGNPQ